MGAVHRTTHISPPSKPRLKTNFDHARVGPRGEALLSTGLVVTMSLTTSTFLPMVLTMYLTTCTRLLSWSAGANRDPRGCCDGPEAHIHVRSYTV